MQKENFSIVMILSVIAKLLLVTSVIIGSKVYHNKNVEIFNSLKAIDQVKEKKALYEKK